MFDHVGSLLIESEPDICWDHVVLADLLNEVEYVLEAVLALVSD